MVFNSWPFILVFLPATWLVFYGLKDQPRIWGQLWLIGASLFFYAYWKLEYLPLLLASLAFNFGWARVIQGARSPGPRRSRLIAGLSVNVLALGYFKYTNFILAALGLTGIPVPGPFDIALPLAISFFTFTQIAYLVDVYRDPTLRYSLVDYAFFVVFFPHLIAGPIVRHHEIIPQLRPWREHFRIDGVMAGAALFILGLGKKCLLADALAPHVQHVYGEAARGTILSAADAWMGTLAFGLQIYFDFSAYSDMALGLAMMFGLRFPANFNSPYQATSLIDFWGRWHLTLTRFFREYVYFSLGGNRRGRARQMFNVLVTMLLSGLWHGAAWTLLIWGALHGFYLVLAHFWKETSAEWSWAQSRPARLAGVALSLVAVLLAWVWFRSGHLQTGWSVTRSMFGLQGPVGTPALIGRSLAAFLPVLLAAVWFLPNSQQLLVRYGPTLEPISAPRGGGLTINFYSALAFGLLFFVVVRELLVSHSTLFIYFKF